MSASVQLPAPMLDAVGTRITPRMSASVQLLCVRSGGNLPGLLPECRPVFSNPLTAGLKPIKSGLSIPCRSPSGDDHTDLSRQTRYQSFIDGHPDRTIIAPVLAQSRNKFFHSRSPSFGMAFFFAALSRHRT
jgi:hypothetical protein